MPADLTATHAPSDARIGSNSQVKLVLEPCSHCGSAKRTQVQIGLSGTWSQQRGPVLPSLSGRAEPAVKPLYRLRRVGGLLRCECLRCCGGLDRTRRATSALEPRRRASAAQAAAPALRARSVSGARP